MSWPVVKIKDVFDVARGGSPRPIQDYLTDDPNGLNWVMIGDTKKGSKYIETTAKKIRKEGLKKTRQVKSGDFLLTNSMSFGRPYIMKTSGCVHDGWLILSPKSEQIYTDYFYYYLGSKEVYSHLAGKAAGAVVKNLNKDVVKELEIPLPPLPEQKRIAAILDKAHQLRQKRQQAITLADDFLRSVFIDKFGNPKDSPYPVHELKTVCTKITDGAHHTPTYTDTGVPFLRVTDINKGKVNWDNTKFISEEEHAELTKRCCPEKGDVLYSKNGTIGVPRLIDWSQEFSIFVSLCLIKPEKDVLLGGYLESFLKTPFALRQATARAKSATVTNLHLVEIREMRLPVPPLEVQEEWIQFASKHEKAKGLLTKAFQTTKDAFNALSQKAFAGEL